jgi:hypothetical protein
MTFAEFRVATDDELLAHAKRGFELGQLSHSDPAGAPSALLQAQFYMAEIDRRQDTKIAQRDFRMELIVIMLIGLELIAAIAGIAITIHEGNEQAIILERVEKAATRAGNMNLVRP